MRLLFPLRLHWQSLLLALGILVIEILIATRFEHLVFVRSYLGDFLVVMLIYYLVRAFVDIPSLKLAGGVLVFSCVVEIVQLLHPADLLGLAPGSFLYILLGNRFSWMDIFMYLGGCVAAYGLDRAFRGRKKGMTP